MTVVAPGVRDVLVLGAGFTGAAVARRARASGLGVCCTVRSETRRAALESEGFRVVVQPELDAGIAAYVTPETHVVVAYPPDGVTCPRVAPACAQAHSIAYVSTVGVYGEHRGPVDDTTPLPSIPSERARRVLDAEATWRSVGATVLRAPGIYGPGRGLHVRVVSGAHKIPGDGTRYLSRIHVEDLATLALAASRVRGETYVVGDLEPAPHGEVVRFIAEEYAVPMPPCVPLDEVHETLRADRRVDPSRALHDLGVSLVFPSYRVGMKRTT